MTTEPLVSVVVPAYNTAATIDEMITSVLRQTLANLELVICDDASTDDTVLRIETYTDPRIRLIRNPENRGEGAARDAAIDAARGRWLAVLDADDAWQPDRLERLAACADDDPNIMAFDNLMVCHHRTNGNMIPWRPVHARDAFGASGPRAKDVSLSDYIRSPRLLIKPLLPREALRKSGIRHSNRKFAADAEFFIRSGLSGLRFRYLPEPLYLYRTTPGSATAKADHHLMRECLEAIAELDGLHDSVASALQFKISDLRKQEALYQLIDALRRHDLPSAAHIIRNNPGALARAPRILLRRTSYVLHRHIHGGAGR